MHDEIGEDLIARNTCRQQLGLRGVIREQSRTYIYKYQRNGDIQKSSEKCRFHRLGRALGGHISLHIILVNAIVLHIGQKTVNKYDPECWRIEFKAEATEREFAVLGCNLKQLRRTLGHTEGEQHGTNNSTDNKYYALYRIGPHNRRDTTQKRIYERDDTRCNDNCANIPAEHRIDGNRQKQKNRAHSSDLRQQITYCNISSCPIAEFQFQIVVCRHAIKTSV